MGCLVLGRGAASAGHFGLLAHSVVLLVDSTTMRAPATPLPLYPPCTGTARSAGTAAAPASAAVPALTAAAASTGAAATAAAAVEGGTATADGAAPAACPSPAAGTFTGGSTSTRTVMHRPLATQCPGPGPGPQPFV